MRALQREYPGTYTLGTSYDCPGHVALTDKAKYHQVKTYNASEFDPYPDVISNVILPQIFFSLTGERWYSVNFDLPIFLDRAGRKL